MRKVCVLFFTTLALIFISCQKFVPKTQPIISTTGKGDVVIFNPSNNTATFITQSGVVFKSVELSSPQSFETYKYFKEQIHNTIDSLFINAEWIGDKVYWYARTNRLNTRNASNLALITIHSSEVVPLCGAYCEWIPVFDPKTGKSIYYSTHGIAEDISIDAWDKAVSITFQAEAAYY